MKGELSYLGVVIVVRVDRSWWLVLLLVWELVQYTHIFDFQNFLEDQGTRNLLAIWSNCWLILCRRVAKDTDYILMKEWDSFVEWSHRFFKYEAKEFYYSLRSKKLLWFLKIWIFIIVFYDFSWISLTY